MDFIEIIHGMEKPLYFILNDNDGYTKFQNGQVVKSKANRAVIFDSPELHTQDQLQQMYMPDML